MAPMTRAKQACEVVLCRYTVARGLNAGRSNPARKAIRDDDGQANETGDGEADNGAADGEESHKSLYRVWLIALMFVTTHVYVDGLETS